MKNFTFEIPSIKEAKKIQLELSKEVVLSDVIDFKKDVRLVGGIDVAYKKTETGGIAYAVLVVMELDSYKIVDISKSKVSVKFPYIPGFLAFREIPVVIEAFKDLYVKPDVWFVDGAGIAHPRRLGLASHFGVLIKSPCIGVAKSRLIGEHEDVPNKQGGWVYLYINGKISGVVLRTKKNCKPLYVSPGWGISVDSACFMVLRCVTKYKLPEPTRIAHNMVEAYKRNDT